MHDDGVGSRNVNPCLNNGGAKQKVVALLIEVAHNRFELPLVHLTVSDNNSRFRNELLQLLTSVFDRCHVIVKEIDLTAALKFTHDRFTNDFRRFFANDSFNG